MKSFNERRQLLALALLTPLVASGCASSPALPEPSTDVEVTVLVYSGRPNPSVVLNEARVVELAQKVAALPANPSFEAASVVPSILGYAGVVVSNGAGAPGLPRHLAVYHGDVELKGEAKSFRVDSDGSLEEWLIQRLVEGEQLSDAVLRVIRGK